MTKQAEQLWDRRDFERRALVDQKYLEVHLLPDGVIKGELLECSMFNYFLSVKDRDVIIPKHAVKYIVFIDSIGDE